MFRDWTSTVIDENRIPKYYSEKYYTIVADKSVSIFETKTNKLLYTVKLPVLSNHFWIDFQLHNAMTDNTMALLLPVKYPTKECLIQIYKILPESAKTDQRVEKITEFNYKVPS